MLFRSEKLGDNNSAASVYSVGYLDKQHRHRVGGSNRGKSKLAVYGRGADKISRYNAVADIVHLLKNNADKHWQSEPPYQRRRFAFGKIGNQDLKSFHI